ncbi:MAG: hypothetical protein V4693_11565 [Pseudomonadota bacterium]
MNLVDIEGDLCFVARFTNWQFEPSLVNSTIKRNRLGRGLLEAAVAKCAPVALVSPAYRIVGGVFLVQAFKAAGGGFARRFESSMRWRRYYRILNMLSSSE